MLSCSVTNQMKLSSSFPSFTSPSIPMAGQEEEDEVLEVYDRDRNGKLRQDDLITKLNLCL